MTLAVVSGELNCNLLSFISLAEKLEQFRSLGRNDESPTFDIPAFVARDVATVLIGVRR